MKTRTMSYTVDANGRFHDRKTGRFVSPSRIRGSSYQSAQHNRSVSPSENKERIFLPPTARERDNLREMYPSLPFSFEGRKLTRAAIGAMQAGEIPFIVKGRPYPARERLLEILNLE